MTNQDFSERTDPDLDAAILAADKDREAYVLQRLRTRRRMAIVAFGQFVFGGAAIIIGGLLLKGWAEHIDHMGTFLSLYFSALAAIIMAYWGIGAYERNTYGGLGGSSYGGYGAGSGGYGGYSTPMNGARPRIVKTGSTNTVTNTTTTTAAIVPGGEPEPRQHRSPDGE